MDKYKLFEKNNLPTPYWNEDREVLEYVYYEDGELRKSDLLSYAIEDIGYFGFYYSYNCRHLTQSKNKNGEYVFEPITGHTHAHTFEDVIKDLYRYPEYFSIPKEDEQYYSAQELKYIDRVRKYLLFMGLKDDISPEKDLTRYQSPQYEKYKRKPIYHLSDKYIEDLITGKKDYLIREYYPKWSEEKEFKPGEKTALITTNDGDFKLYIEVIKSEIKDYKDYKNQLENKLDLKDNDKVLIEYVKILEIFNN